MTKKLVSQNDSESTENKIYGTENQGSTLENSNNIKETADTPNNNQRQEYIYSTPLKKIKLNIPLAPKKKRRNKDVNEYNIRGKNLLNLFKLVA